MARRRTLNWAGPALLAALGAGIAVNRSAVRRLERAPDPVDPDELQMPDDVTEHLVTLSDGTVRRVVESGPKDGRLAGLLLVERPAELNQAILDLVART